LFPNAFEARFPNAGIDCYLTWATPAQIKDWRKHERLITEHLVIDRDAAGNKIIAKYQRSTDQKRVRAIRKLLESRERNSILPPILSQSVVLNVRESFRVNRRATYVKLPTNLNFHVVDGQHRVEALEGLNDSVIAPIPVTIVRGLSELQEAALFLLINHTQKKVSASVRLLDIARMLGETRNTSVNPDPLFEALRFKSASKHALSVAAEQVLKSSHFWFDKVNLPEGEEE
jgi:DGQHR domain-containing protein